MTGSSLTHIGPRPIWRVSGAAVYVVEESSWRANVDLADHMTEGRTNEVTLEVWPDTCFANPGVPVWLEGNGTEYERRV